MRSSYSPCARLAAIALARCVGLGCSVYAAVTRDATGYLWIDDIELA